MRPSAPRPPAARPSAARRLLPLLAAGGLLSGCAPGWSPLDIFFVEVEQERFCKTQELDVPAGVPGSVELEQTLPFDVPSVDQLPEGGVELFLQLLGGTLTAVDDPSRLDGVRAVSVSVRTVGSEEPPLELLSVTRTEADGGGPVTLTGGGRRDLARLMGQSVELHLKLSGSVPTEDWRLRVEACGYVRAKATYGRFIGAALGL
jgi:hypothetical protein